MFVAVLVSVTAASGTTAPDASVTVPLASPARVWASAGRQNAKQKRIDSKVDVFANRIDPPCRKRVQDFSTTHDVISARETDPCPIARIHRRIQDKKYLFQEIKFMASYPALRNLHDQGSRIEIGSGGSRHQSS